MLVAVQLQPVPAVTVTVPVVAVDDVRFDEVGEIVNVQGTPACVTVKVCPAIVRVPVRELVPVLAVTDHVTVPAPVPLAGVHVSQVVALLELVHVQVEPLGVTVTVPLPAADPGLALAGEIP